MPFNVQMTNRQQVAIGVSILDQDNQPFDELPDGATITFESSDAAIASVVVRPDGLNADIGSGTLGTATITVRATGFTPAPPDDTVTIKVVNSLPGKLNLTVGEPSDEV